MSAAPRPSFLWFLAEAFVLTGVLLLAGWFPTQRMSGPEGIRAMGAGCLVSLIASVFSALPARMAGGNPAREALAVMGACMAIRLLIVAAGGVVVILSSDLPRKVLLIWLALSYAVLLIADTRWVLKAVSPRK